MRKNLVYGNLLIFQRINSDLIPDTKIIKYKTQNGFIIDINDNVNELSKIKNYDVQSNKVIYYLALNYYSLGNVKQSLYYFNHCIQSEYKLKDVFMYRGLIYNKMNQSSKSCDDFYKARLLGNNEVEEYIKEYCN